VAEINYNGQFTTTANGPYVLVLSLLAIFGILNVAVDCSLTKREYAPDYSDNIVLEYGHTCDIGNIIYQYGFKNKIVFADKVDLVKPTYETIKTGESREGYFFVNNAVAKKTYKMVFYAPEYIADAMSILELHDTITITNKDGDSISVDEVHAVSTPAGNCFFKCELELISDPMNSSNCCTDLNLT